MTTLLAVSPHLDDAVFSVGALLARHAAAGWRVVVATCFTASMPDPTGFALACQTDKGYGPEVDYMALRRAEDRRACALLGAQAAHLPFAEAPHRGYGDAAALFGPRLAADRIAGEVTIALRGLIERSTPALLLGPACIGDHVDHWIVRQALESVARPSLWADLPYAARAASTLPQTEFRYPCGPELKRKLRAARTYRSQIGFQFGAANRMADLLSLDGDEALISPAPGNGS